MKTEQILAPSHDETYEQWHTRMMLQCGACPHRLIGHNSEEHLTKPFACRSCGCKSFKLTKKGSTR